MSATSVDESVLDPEVKILDKYKASNYREKGKIFHTTIRKFKGLEAKAIMIIDIDMDLIEDKGYKNLLYVACSRARHFLHLAIEEIEEISNKNKSTIKSTYELAEVK